ncbi:hypothetical protein [Winogradskya humida]|uniref:hypothetical protein n=1 Tax=Winogradskya humida TaxID=113566 RepID=UPI001941E9EF|nr:hypothetical protein [Actinoplanes humidus]
MRRLLGILFVLVLAGCGTPAKTMTGAEAIQQVDDYLKDAVAAAPAGVRLVRKAEATNGSGCVRGLSDSGFTGQVKAEVAYEAQVDPAVAAQYLQALGDLFDRKWGKPERSADNVGVYVDEVRLYGDYWPGIKRLTVGGNSGCVWVGGTPGPDDRP